MRLIRLGLEIVARLVPLIPSGFGFVARLRRSLFDGHYQSASVSVLLAVFQGTNVLYGPPSVPEALKELLPPILFAPTIFFSAAILFFASLNIRSAVASDRFLPRIQIRFRR